jgi:alpha-beta hydrolase superfamily lysophospholipase
MKKWFRRLSATLLVLFLLVNSIAFFHARKFTHFDPDATQITDPSKVSLLKKVGILFTGVSLPKPWSNRKPDRPYETIFIQSNKRTACWSMKVEQAKGTVVLCHGYGAEKSSMLDKAYVLLDAGYNVLLPDLGGAGTSEGNECTIGYKEAEEVKACVRYLHVKDDQPVFLLGTSMGAAAVMRACSTESLPVKAMILECPFGSMRQTVKNRFEMVGVPSFLLADLLVFWGGAQNGFNAFSHNPEDYARRIKLPVLLLYGAKDDRVKPSETQRIYDHLAGPKKRVQYPLAGHENYLNQYRTQWTADVLRFLAQQSMRS